MTDADRQTAVARKAAKAAEREERKAAKAATRQAREAAKRETPDKWPKPRPGAEPMSPGDVVRMAEIRATRAVDVREPLVLIAQPNRSGGTLLSQLFDGHPELHTHPWELELGTKFDPWPALDLGDSPEAWARALFEHHVYRAFNEGYSKDKSSLATGHNEQERFPFLLAPSLYYELFARLAHGREVASLRDVLDLHFTAYFNAWLDNANLYGPTKRWVIGFRGKMRHAENLVRFFDAYPDGRHITIMRDAKANIASRLKYRAREDVEVAIDKAIRGWQRATTQQLDVKQTYGDRVFTLTFEELVRDPERMMRALAAWLGIGYDAILTTPTFNRIPIRASSHFRVERHGVLTEPLEHWRKLLSAEQAATIDAGTRDLYAEFAALARDDLERVGS